MSHRRLAVLPVLVAVVAVGASGCGSAAAAVQVDDESIGRQDFEDQLDLVYDNDDLRSVLFGDVDRRQLRDEGGPRGSYRQEYVGAMVTLQVQSMVIPRVLRDEGLEVSARDRARVVRRVDRRAPDAFDGVPEDVRDRYLDAFAGIERLRSELDEDELGSAVGEAMRGADVAVDSRYGRWDADDVTVAPPPGPAGSDDDGATGTGRRSR
ncbi:MAG TPA: hypothetical protein VFW63_12570 [Acidimicrobiales bacterium]|nr:hypothetical protein [Acidimicrobiales bacterium]